MKRCTKCKVKQEDSAFRWRSKENRARYSHYKTCERIIQKGYYEKAKQSEAGLEMLRQRRRRNTLAKYQRARKFVYEYLKTHPCVDCGESDIFTLEFDHLRDKRFGVAYMVSKNYSVKAIASEIEKCEIRCANCHKRKTAKEQGWYKDFLEEDEKYEHSCIGAR